MSYLNDPSTRSETNQPRKKKNLTVTVIGESGVGKSSLALNFVKGEFHDDTPSTIGGKCYQCYQFKIL